MSDRHFWKSGEPLFDKICDVYAETAGKSVKQALKKLDEDGYYTEANDIIEWMKIQYKRLNDVCDECSGDCVNCGIMPVMIEIEGVLRND